MKNTKGSIYAIIDNETFEVYIGSTVQSIKRRYGKHMTDMRMYLGLSDRPRCYRSSFDILIRDNYKVICIHEFHNINNHKDLKLFESLYMLKFKKQGVKVINGCISNKEARVLDWRNFGLKEIDFSAKTLFKNRPLLLQ
tara:strand:- start:1035 stop:1451 length:417 start_codon:yes stop_codon:yes gene_type:complete